MTAQHESTEVILISVDAASGSPGASVAVESSKRIQDVDAEAQSAEGTTPEGVVGELTMRVEEFGRQWRPLISALRDVFQLSDEQPQTDGFHVDTVKVGLGVNADGKLFLIGKVGAKASVEVTLRRGRSSP